MGWAGSAPRNFATGANPVSVAVGDFDADGKLDLATANQGGDDVSVLLGNGDGTFRTPSNISIGSAPTSMAVGDFNGDGKLDLGVTSNVYTPGYYGPGSWGYYGYYPGNWYPGYFEGRANVLLGNGDGSFAGPSTTSLGTSYHNAALAADLNGDGFDDFVSLNADYGYVSVLRGDSNGLLPGPYSYSTGYYSHSVAAEDLDADGDTDLVTANSEGVWLVPGDGAGGFGTVQHYATGSGVASVVLRDFNHDGKLDIAATADTSGGSVCILRGQGNGIFSSAENFANDPGTYALAAGDFSGDGWLDIATTDGPGNSVSVLINDQSWPFVPPPVSVSDAAVVTEGNSGTVNATFTLTLAYASIDDVTVHYATADLSAAAGSDYVAASGDVIIPAGHTSATFTVAVKGDRVAEPNETFAVNLTATTNATIADGEGIGAILDDEPRISINDTTVTEGHTGTRPATFTVNLSEAYDVPVVIGYATANGTATARSDYNASTGSLTIPAGKTSGTFTVLVIGDKTGEPNETFLVNLSNPGNAVIADGQGAGTIVDDEPRVSINDVTRAEGSKGHNTLFTFTVTLSAPLDKEVKLSFRTVNGTATTTNKDYAAKTGTLTFKPGETTKTITITVKGDPYPGDDETFYVDLFGLSNNAQFSKSRGIGTILNDD